MEMDMEMDNKGSEDLLRKIYKNYGGHHGYPDLMMTHFMSNVLDICDHLDLKIRDVVRDANKFRKDVKKPLT
jgi:hypothetical protein